MMKYMLCGRGNATELAAAVQKHIYDDWTPQGGIAIVSVRDEVWYYQAMVKDNVPKNSFSGGIEIAETLAK